jgi:hypothetical protein
MSKKPDHDRNVTRLKPCLCPFCGCLWDAAGKADGSVWKPPQAGDTTVCLNCAEVLVFETPTELRKLTPEDQVALAIDPDWEKTRQAQARIRAKQHHGMRTAQAERGRGKPQ